ERARAALAGADAVVVWAPDPAGEVAARLARLGVGRAIVAPAQPPANQPAAPHTAVWLADALRPLGMAPPTDPATLAAHLAPLRAPAEASAEAQTLWRRWELGRRVVALHPGSGSPAKRWPAERFAEVSRLARDAGYQPLLLAGEADAQALAETQAALARLGGAAVAARGLALATVAALLARCAGYIGCDSGVSHLAGLVGAPTVAIFGPTAPARWAPLGPRVRTAQAPDRRLDQLAAAAVWATLVALIGDTDAT
ncbi:MAG TPA: glycosyltransferase family 9 protein, partial [Ktedonobacterales bacterium]